MPRRSPLSDVDPDILDADFVAGVEEAVERVERFLQEKIVENPEIEGDVHLELAQLGRGSDAILKTWLFSQGDEPPDMASSVVDAAQADGQAVGSGKLRYQITIKGHKGRCAFSLEYAAQAFDDANEAPNARGLVSQALNHTQEAWNMCKDLMRDARLEHKEQLKSNQDEIRSLRSGQIEVIQVMASLMDGKHARDIELKKIEKGESRKDEVAGFLMQGIPHIVNKIVGGDKPVIEAKTTPLEQMLHGWLSTFTQDQLQATVQSGQIQLRQDQMMGMLGIFQAVMEKQAAAQKAENAGPSAQNGVAGPASPASPHPSPSDPPPVPPQAKGP